MDQNSAKVDKTFKSRTTLAFHMDPITGQLKANKGFEEEFKKQVKCFSNDDIEKIRQQDQNQNRSWCEIM